jgi:NTE family protein
MLSHACGSARIVSEGPRMQPEYTSQAVLDSIEIAGKTMEPSKSPSVSARHSRALVLGGGGPVGRAWATGLAQGFAKQGIDFGAADLIIGTSAGAVVGAQLALKQSLGAPPDVVAPPPSQSLRMAVLADVMARAAISPDSDPLRAEIGKMALDAPTVSEDASISRSMFTPFIGKAWPDKLRVITVNARTGKLQIWDASSGAPLERAIAASTAAPCFWPPITIDGERYIDGGVRSMLNADLAIGAGIVVAVSCFGLTDEAAPPFFKTLNSASLAGLDGVRRGSATLALVEPQAEFLALTKHGAAMMDGKLALEAYRLGRLAAVAEAPSVRRVWNAVGHRSDAEGQILVRRQPP